MLGSLGVGLAVEGLVVEGLAVDGTAVDLVVGIDVGVVGRMVGEDEGLAVVGRDVGILVGKHVDGVVGLADGEGVGVVGLGVGLAVGLAVGLMVGVLVGVLVGSDCREKPPTVFSVSV